MAAESRIPAEKDPAKPWHWSFEWWVWTHYEWLPHHIEGRYLRAGGGLVSIEAELSAYDAWRHEVLSAWASLEAVHADAVDALKLKPATRNGMWAWKREE